MAKHLNADDEAIGYLIRTRRIELGISQAKLGAQLGITFQQIQKYERGVNRVTGGRLRQMARALHVDPAYFFPGDDGNIEVIKLINRPDALRLLKAFNRINGKDRGIIVRITELVAANTLEGS